MQVAKMLLSAKNASAHEETEKYNYNYKNEEQLILVKNVQEKKKAGFWVTSAWYQPGNATTNGSRQRTQRVQETIEK